MKLPLILLVVLSSLSVSAQKYGVLHVQLDYYLEESKASFSIYFENEMIGVTDIDGYFYPSKKLKGELLITNPNIGSTKQFVNLSNSKDLEPIYITSSSSFKDSIFKKFIEKDEHLSKLMECNVISDTLPPSEIVDSLSDFHPAEFPGGTAALSQFITQNIVYPEIARELGLIGKLYVSFIIDTDGMISCIKLVKGIPNCPECDLEGLRVISILPPFKPGTINGKKEESHFTLPINFRLS